jgi:MFS family permease
MEETLTIDVGEKVQIKQANLVMLFIVCFAGNLFGGVISTLMSVYLPAVVREFQGNKSESQLNDIGAFINALFIFGWAIGGVLWGMISDKMGRKTGLLLAIGGYSIFTILTCFAQNWTDVMLCRFMSGFGAGGMLVTSFTLISEAWPERTKAVYTGLLSIAIPIGIFSAGLINFFVSGWREGFLIGIIPLLVAIAGYWMMDESGLWLRHRDEKRAMKKPVGTLNGKTLLIGSVIFGTMLIGLWAIFSWLPTWLKSLPGGDAKAGGISMMFLGGGGLAGGFLSGWAVNLAGLRKSLIASFAVCAFLSFILFKTNSIFSTIIYVEIAVLALFFGASQGILSIYIPQLFPTGVRAAATGLCFNIGRMVTAVAVLCVGVLVTVLGGYGNSLFIFSLVFVAGLLVVVFVKNIQPERLE